MVLVVSRLKKHFCEFLAAKTPPVASAFTILVNERSVKIQKKTFVPKLAK